MKDCVTYRLAYVSEDVTLCADCAEAPEYPLGYVQHGSRPARCEGCEDRDES